VQRLFSSFPSGAPGIGLLLLRVAVGVALVGQGVQLVGRSGGAVGTGLIGGAWLVAGLAFLAGALTPAAAGLGATLVAALLYVHAPGVGRDGGLLLVMVVALGLLGPGAYSVDARLFGRREIEVPRRADTPKGDTRSVVRDSMEETR
jgi:uncharacterized membrane protein YphA (DoxX/SURF4 family)